MSRDWLYDEEFDVSRDRAPNKKRLLHLENSLRAMARSVEAAGAKLYFVDGLPKICSHKEFEIGKARRPFDPCQGSRSASLRDRSPLSNLYHLATEGTNASILDPHPYLCSQEVCHSNLNGRLLYWDGSPHFLTTFPAPLKEMFLTIFSTARTQH